MMASKGLHTCPTFEQLQKDQRFCRAGLRESELNPASIAAFQPMLSR